MCWCPGKLEPKKSLKCSLTVLPPACHSPPGSGGSCYSSGLLHLCWKNLGAANACVLAAAAQLLERQTRIPVSSSSGDMSTGVRRGEVGGRPCNSLEQYVPASSLGAFQFNHNLLHDQISSDCPLYAHENLCPLTPVSCMSCIMLKTLAYIHNVLKFCRILKLEDGIYWRAGILA